MSATNSSVPAGASPEANADLTKRISEAAKVMGITEEQVWIGLGRLGIRKKDEDALELLSAETTTEADAKICFEKTIQVLDIGPARFKAGWAKLKGSVKAADQEQKPRKLGKFAEWTDQELIAAYGVDSDSRIADEFDKRAKGQPCVIFNEDGTVYVAPTAELLRCARRGQKMPETYLVDGSLRRVCRVGYFPQNWMEECPLHADTMLVNGYCDKCHLHWTKVSMDARVVARLALGIGEVKKGMTSAERTAFIKDLEDKGAATLLGVPDIRLKYDEAKEENQLPVLRRRVSKDSRGKDPFYINNREY